MRVRVGHKKGCLSKKQGQKQYSETINKTIAEILTNFPTKPQHDFQKVKDTFMPI